MLFRFSRSRLVGGSFLLASLAVGVPTAADTARTVVATDHHGKAVRMLRGGDAPLAIAFQAGESLPGAVARQFAPAFGVRDPSSELQVMAQHVRRDFGQSIHYQQLFRGLPVIGGELRANVDVSSRLTAMSGEVSQVKLRSLAPALGAQQAVDIAIVAVAKWYGVERRNLTASEPVLSIYDPALIGPGSAPQRLVWQTRVTTMTPLPVDEYVLVDAYSGALALHFSRMHTALERRTYTAGNSSDMALLPGTLLCDEVMPCPVDDTDAQLAHRYAGDTWQFYFDTHGRDSIDGRGMPIISTVHYGVDYANAAWHNGQMLYGDGFSAADDVVAHEITHGVTEQTSALFYYYQSGAINESLSDLWGEFVDLTNGSGTDSPEVRWLMGEDVPEFGAIRSMKTPTAYGDPDRMLSPLYWAAPGDSGGVHFNSGINNKAVYLMVDGDSFNGRVVAGIGIDKVAKIYYAVQTAYLTSGSDYLDLYNALLAACAGLVGTDGISATDCEQVRLAADAVEMQLPPANDLMPKAALCPENTNVGSVLLRDSFESGTGNWAVTDIIGPSAWQLGQEYASDGVFMLGGAGSDVANDSAIAMSVPVTVPVGKLVFLHFEHAFGFEYDFDEDAYFDGGVVEYSTDGGELWQDAGALIDAGRRYNGQLLAGNPLFGREAFGAASHGYNSTRLNLAALAGQEFLLRFRITADITVASLGWAVDDVRIYTCNRAPTASSGAARTVDANSTVTLDGSASDDPDSDNLSYQWTQLSGTPVVINAADSASASFVAPSGPEVLVFELTVDDGKGGNATGTVAITVDAMPQADAGVDMTVAVNAAVTLDASLSSDPEGAPLVYQWAQTDGAPVILSAMDVSNPMFNAPAVPEVLDFELTVTDIRGQTSSDTVTVTVQAAGTDADNQVPTAQAGAARTVDANSTVTLDGSASSDPDGDSLEYQWAQLGGTPVMINGADSVSASFLAPPGPDTLVFKLTVDDGKGGSASDSITITVQATPADAVDGSDGGGCSIAPRGGFDPLWVAMTVLLVLLHLVRCRQAGRTRQFVQ